MTSRLPDTLAEAYEAGYQTGLHSPTPTVELIDAGYGDGTFDDRGSDFTLVPSPPPGNDDRRTDWCVGYAHALEDLAEAARNPSPSRER